MDNLKFLPSAIELLPIGALKPYARNPRTHSDDQIARLAAAIAEFGWTMPVLINDDNEIISGHGRLAAAQNLGLNDVPAIRMRHLSDAKVKALRIADNKIATDAGWDEELLSEEFHELNSLGYNLPLTGFSEEELQSLLSPIGDGEIIGDPDDVPEEVDYPASREGDLWILGNHRILCGDATKQSDVDMLLAGSKPHLMVTDPPYGVNYDPDWRNRADRANGKPYGATAIGLVTNDDRADWSDAYALFPGEVVYVWHPGGARSVEFFNSLSSCGFDVRMQIIWAKSHFAIGRGHYHVQHEPCWYAVRHGGIGHWQGDRTQTTLWQIDKPVKSDTGHSTQKPVECMRRPMINNSAPRDSVYDPFVGSGTTIIAGEMTGRKVYAMEIAPQYVDVSVIRWQNATGREATLDGDGRTFAQIAEERRSESQ